MKVIEIDDSNRREYDVEPISIEQATAQYGHANNDQVQLWDNEKLVAYAVWKQGSNHYSFCKKPYMATGPIAGPCEWDITKVV